jgi:hypothetical protein
MELAGLEPATSWVRSKVAIDLSSAHFQEIPRRRSSRSCGQFVRN